MSRAREIKYGDSEDDQFLESGADSAGETNAWSGSDDANPKNFMIPDHAPNSPKLLKLFVQSTAINRDIEPEDFLGGIAELLFLTIVCSFIITWFYDMYYGTNRLTDNPIRNMVGYNNPCAFWDQPPTLYFAAFMFCPMVYMGIRYATMDIVRAKLTSGVQKRGGMCSVINWMYALSQCILMGIFIITPKVPEQHPTMTIHDLHWYMRVHSLCFLQFVPILCVTMSANYFEGYLSGNPKSKPTAVAWLVLSFYVCATLLETVFATYAIMAYEGNYAFAGREQFYKLNPIFMELVDYCWFISLPLAASFQPSAPNLQFKIALEPSWRHFQENDGDGDEDEDDQWDCDDGGHTMMVMLRKVMATMMLIWANALPWLALLIWAAGASHDSHILIIGGICIPLFCTCLLWLPVKFDGYGLNPFTNNCCCFTVRGSCFTPCNFTGRLLRFAKAAGVPNFRPSYAKWFEDQCDDDPSVATRFGANTRMIYGWQANKERLESMGNRIQTGELTRESELALSVMNNMMFPEAGKFCLGYDAEDHAFVRPYLARAFDCAQGKEWTLEVLRHEFQLCFSTLSVLDNNLVSRNMYDITDPTKSKTILTQLCLKVLHKIAFNRHIAKGEAEELAALQTQQLLPAACPAAVTRSLWMWSIIAGPARDTAAKWIKRYKWLCQQKWPELANATDRQMDLLGSSFLDTFLQAGGRSVPLSVDLTLGYILSKNRPECLNGMDFEKSAENIRMLMMECMRYHPLVTVLPTWVKNTEDDTCEWKHELICLDRALADPDVFPEPNEFNLQRDWTCSMAWADFACVNGDKAHPDSHCCPGKELSINMVVAFVLEYFAAGPWDVTPEAEDGDDSNGADIKFNYYGSKGFKCTKVRSRR
jgi:hypothetical protein